MAHSECNELTLHGNICEGEKKYCEFLSRIIMDYFDMEDNFTSRVKEILDSGKEVLAGEFEDYPEFLECAYLLQFGVQDTCWAVRKFNKSAMEYTGIIERFWEKLRLNVCCLGGEGIFAVIGICKVIHESVVQFGFLDDVPVDIQVFIIDKNRRWKRLYKHIVSAANEEYRKVKLKLEFLVGDITEFSEDVKLRIGKSHIVTMAKFLSQLTSSKDIRRVIKNTLIKMKKNAILFHLDNESAKHHETLKNVISENVSFREILGSHSPERCTLKEKARQTCTRSDYYFSAVNLNINYLPILSSTWIKNPAIKLKIPRKEDIAVKVNDASKRGYRARSSNTLRNSTAKFKLYGKFAHIDMEKKNKDCSHRQAAKEVARSRQADFDDWMD